MREKNVTALTLSNGIRIAHQYAQSPVVYCGLSINTGTRDEQKNEHGMAHFLEHTLFKGTKKRKAYHINNRLENVGGELNAFTSKEETCVQATVLKSDAEKAIELIADIMFNSVFPEKEIELEKDVVCDEIDLYLDTPLEQIFDDFEELIFANSLIGRNILGSKRSVKKFTTADIRQFINRTYNTNQMVFSIVGQVSLTKIQHWCDKYLAPQQFNTRNYVRETAADYQVFTKIVKRPNHQAHCTIGNRGYHIDHPNRMALYLLINMLGGPMSNSILNTVLREKHGLVYNIEAYYTPYSDTGLAGIYFGSAKSNLDKCIELISAELNKLRTTQLTAMRLQRAKKQFVGQLAIGNESNENKMLGMAKSILVQNEVKTMAQTLETIANITVADMLDVSNEVFNPNQLSTLIYQ